MQFKLKNFCTFVMNCHAALTHFSLLGHINYNDETMISSSFCSAVIPAALNQKHYCSLKQ